MDDAIYIAPNDNGWELITAIADPSKHISFDSPLEQSARARQHTVFARPNCDYVTDGFIPRYLLTGFLAKTPGVNFPLFLR